MKKLIKTWVAKIEKIDGNTLFGEAYDASMDIKWGVRENGVKTVDIFSSKIL